MIRRFSQIILFSILAVGLTACSASTSSQGCCKGKSQSCSKDGSKACCSKKDNKSCAKSCTKACCSKKDSKSCSKEK